jgi:hypothetical protein
VDRQSRDGDAVFLPDSLVPEHAAQAGPAAGWLRSVPGIVQQAASRWQLDVDDGGLMHGGFAVVMPVHRGEEACVLKISQLTEAVAAEALALSAWDGQGAVRLLEADPATGVLLLERLNPQRTLFDLPWPAAAHVAAALLRRLASVPAPPGVPPLRQVAAVDPHGLAAFWAIALGYVTEPGNDDSDGASIVDPDGVGPAIGFLRVPEGKTAKNRMHIDIRVAGKLPWDVAEREKLIRATAAGLVTARATTVREESYGEHPGHVVMLDPEGNEFCVA